MNYPETTCGFKIQEIPKRRSMAPDIAWLSRSRNMMRGYMEVDVTDTLRMIRKWRNQNGKSLSFTTFLVVSVAKAVAAVPNVYCSHMRNDQVAYYEDVNILTMVEISDEEGERIPVGHLFRAADKLGAEGIQKSLDEFQSNYNCTDEIKKLDLLATIPRSIRRLILGGKPLDPRFIQSTMGNVLISNVSMFLPHRAAWVSGQSNHTIAIWVSSIVEKPCIVNGSILPRKILCLTIDLDHDLIDGAPGARFASTLVRMIEKGTVLSESSNK